MRNIRVLIAAGITAAFIVVSVAGYTGTGWCGDHPEHPKAMSPPPAVESPQKPEYPQAEAPKAEQPPKPEKPKVEAPQPEHPSSEHPR